MSVIDKRVKVDFRYFISLALDNKFAWQLLPSILNDFSPTLETAKEVIEVLVEELKKLHSQLTQISQLKTETSDVEIIDIDYEESKGESHGNYNEESQKDFNGKNLEDFCEESFEDINEENHEGLNEESYHEESNGESPGNSNEGSQDDSNGHSKIECLENIIEESHESDEVINEQNHEDLFEETQEDLNEGSHESSEAKHLQTIESNTDVAEDQDIRNVKFQNRQLKDKSVSDVAINFEKRNTIAQCYKPFGNLN